MTVVSSLILWAVFASSAETPIEVRVGIVAYQDSRAEVDRFQRLLAEIAAGSPRPFEIRFAIGTYGDVMHWMNRKYIDVAVLSPGIFAETLKSPPDQSRWRYLATMGLRPAESPMATEERRRPGYHYEYRAICVVAATSSLRRIADVRRAAEHGGVQFLFVHPLSVSGRIAPELALRQVGITPKPEDIEYTYSHSNSIRLVTEPIEGVERVAFVWDDPPRLPPDQESKIRVLPFPELEKLLIPQNAVATRSDFEHADLVAAMLKQHVDADGRHDFEQFENWAERYVAINDWSRAIRLPAEPQDTQTVSLDELGRILQHFVRSQTQPPRIALVLSGGGAKCAYQVGAVAAVEEELAKLRSQGDEPSLDIGLVVGTSGGAINALPIALGITASPEGRADFRGVWESLDQQEIVRPSKLVRWNIGLWFVTIQASLVLWLVRRRVAAPERRTGVIAKIFIILAIPQILVGLMRWAPWRLLGDNHMLHHVWLWGMFGVGWSGWCMLVLGTTGLVAQRWFAKRGKHLEGPPRLVRWLLAVGLIGLPGLQLATVFFRETTLTDGTGIEHALASKLPKLINDHLTRVGDAPLNLAGAVTDAEKLITVSTEIVARCTNPREAMNNPLRRDLILTGSCLSKSARELPSDLYFYLGSGRAQSPQQFGEVVVPLVKHPDKLLDVVMGSGTIFPAFPARTLNDFPRPGERVELIDGGFVHNSPIEAAVLWGATHVILIEASPNTAKREGRNFLQNSIDAFNHLYIQAQLADARSKEKVVIFTLRPQPPHICVLDFASNLVKRAIDAGYDEARGEIRTGSTHDHPSWEKSLGEPVFLDVR